MKVTYGRGYVYSLRYHIVFCVKYRHKVLINERALRLKEMFKLWGGHLWNSSYFVTTISDVSEEVIAHYINSQKERGDKVGSEGL